MLTGLNLSDMEAGYKRFTREALARISGALRRGQENKLERRVSALWSIIRFNLFINMTPIYKPTLGAVLREAIRENPWTHTYEPLGAGASFSRDRCLISEAEPRQSLPV